MKLYPCDICGTLKNMQSKKKDGTIFYSCPNWKDDKHTKAREQWKQNQKNKSNNQPVYQHKPVQQPTYNPPSFQEQMQDDYLLKDYPEFEDQPKQTKTNDNPDGWQIIAENINALKDKIEELTQEIRSNVIGN